MKTTVQYPAYSGYRVIGKVTDQTFAHLREALDLYEACSCMGEQYIAIYIIDKKGKILRKILP